MESFSKIIPMNWINFAMSWYVYISDTYTSLEKKRTTFLSDMEYVLGMKPEIVNFFTSHPFPIVSGIRPRLFNFLTESLQENYITYFPQTNIIMYSSTQTEHVFVGISETKGSDLYLSATLYDGDTILADITSWLEKVTIVHSKQVKILPPRFLLLCWAYSNNITLKNMYLSNYKLSVFTTEGEEKIFEVGTGEEVQEAPVKETLIEEETIEETLVDEKSDVGTTLQEDTSKDKILEDSLSRMSEVD